MMTFEQFKGLAMGKLAFGIVFLMSAESEHLKAEERARRDSLCALSDKFQKCNEDIKRAKHRQRQGQIKQCRQDRASIARELWQYLSHKK